MTEGKRWKLSELEKFKILVTSAVMDAGCCFFQVCGFLLFFVWVPGSGTIQSPHRVGSDKVVSPAVWLYWIFCQEMFCIIDKKHGEIPRVQAIGLLLMEKPKRTLCLFMLQGSYFAYKHKTSSLGEFHCFIFT